MHLRTDAQTARSKRGFTLLEIVVAIGLMALAFAIGFTAVRVWRTRTGVRAAAQRLMADLAWARQCAMTTGSPVGLFFSPSAAGPGYHVARAEAGLTGETALERTVAFDDDEGLVLWCGQWEGTTTSNDFPASAGATDPAARAWLDRGSAQWRSVAFTANGLPMSVNMPHASGTRYIAVCSGAEGEGDALRAAGPSYTILISPMGQMSMREGIPGFQTAPDGLGKRTSPTLPPLPTSPSLPPEHRPQIETFTADPMLKSAMLPSGGDALVRADGSVALVVTATDERGHRLHCAWGSAWASAPSPMAPAAPTSDMITRTEAGGTWSVEADAPTTMVRDPGGARWTGTAEWFPPADAQVGAWYALGVRVSDDLQRSSTAWLIVQVVAQGGTAMCYNKRSDAENVYIDVGGAWTDSLAVRSASSTEEMALPRSASSDEQTAVGFTADGSLLLTCRSVSRREMRFFGAHSLEALVPGSTTPSAASLVWHPQAMSADGGRLIFSVESLTPGSPSQLQLTSPSGDTQQTLVTDAYPRYGPSEPSTTAVRFHPDGMIAAVFLGHILVWNREGSEMEDVCHPPPPPPPLPEASPSPTPMPIAAPPIHDLQWRAGGQASLAIWAEGEIFEITRQGRNQWVRGSTLLSTAQAGAPSGTFTIARSGALAWKTSGRDATSAAFVTSGGAPQSLGEITELTWLSSTQLLTCTSPHTSEQECHGRYALHSLQGGSADVELFNEASRLVAFPAPGP